MGLFRSLFNEMKKQGEELLKENSATPPKKYPQNPPTRWAKAVIELRGIINQVSKIDPDGVDVVCVSHGATDTYRNIKDMKELEAMVTSKLPSGPCHMGKAMEEVLNEAFAKGFAERPCSILVLTAGRPDDHEALTKTIGDAAKKVEKADDLSITFVQIGDDAITEKYLKYLDEELVTTSASGEDIDIVDAIKDEDCKKLMGEKQDEGFLSAGKGGALLGAFAGAALGAGGMYIHNKMKDERRTAGWNGKWRSSYDGEEIAILTVKDDGSGNLEINGWPEEGTATGEYAENDEGGMNVHFTQPGDSDIIVGIVEDEHTIAWSDGTRWKAIPPDGGHWAAYVGAAATCAATTGAVSYIIQKKFFKKVSNHVSSDYIIVLDCSEKMALPIIGA